jgi:hypothetical protein
MVGWVTQSETAICLTCHRAMDLRWRVSPDGVGLQAIAPAREVARERDGSKPELQWVTLQMRCPCGTTLGILVELAPVAVA